jgi:glycosyltransferase involved in cell wall biosynthesis
MPLLAEHTAAKRVYDLFWGRQLVKEAKRLVAVSAVEVDQYLEAGIPPEKIALIPNGLDLEEFSQLPPRGSFRAQFGIPPESQMVLSLGRLHRIKGLDHLIAAFGTLRRDLPNAVLMLAGPDDGDLARLRKIAAEAHLQEQVLFPGPLYGPNRLAAFVDADLLAAPSEHEIFGLSPFEALMCGTPAVVTQDTGAGRLIREAGAGYLVPYGDDDALASAMLEALADRAEAERRVASGQAFVQKRLRWESIVGELEALYTAEIAEPAAKASVSV